MLTAEPCVFSLFSVICKKALQQASFSRYNEFKPAAYAQIELLDYAPASGTGTMKDYGRMEAP